MINLDYLKELLLPLDYQLDTSKDYPVFWKTINHNDLRTAYAFSLVVVNLMQYSVSIEGLNEPRVNRAIRAGLIEIKSTEEVDQLREVVFETDLGTPKKLEAILPFFETQLEIISTEAIYTDAYKKSISNIKLLVEAANNIVY